jgi:pimeloyl-ACP methyl ester carboxylesterase
MPYTNNNAVKIYYEAEGQGLPIVMLHGGGGDLETWQERGYTESLRTDYGLILIDERGHGKSDKPVETKVYDKELHKWKTVKKYYLILSWNTRKTASRK